MRFDAVRFDFVGIIVVGKPQVWHVEQLSKVTELRNFGKYYEKAYCYIGQGRL